MKLADFITQEMEAILVQWEGFAATCLPAARHMSPLLLRDHSKQILMAVAKDLGEPQSASAQEQKSRGLAPVLQGAPATAAQTHGVLRAMGGFDIEQMASEYRALRASVLRLWMLKCEPDASSLGEVIRFNEAIDQALAESIKFFNDKLEERRNLFLGMLGHDMRTPLQVIQMTAEHLRHLNAGDKVSSAARRLINSGAYMKGLLDDLIAYNRTQLGMGIPITPMPGDLAELFTTELDQLRSAYPERQLELQVRGPTTGMWDGLSLQRLLGNLVVNAIKYGDAASPVVVSVMGQERQIAFEVRNTGAPIEPHVLESMFEPLKQGEQPAGTHHSSDGSLGLGLYIVREIARAHGGDIQARSENSQTVFAVTLRRDSAVH